MAIVRKILITVIPLLLFHLLRKKSGNRKPPKKPGVTGLTDAKIVEGKIVNAKKRKN